MKEQPDWDSILKHHGGVKAGDCLLLSRPIRNMRDKWLVVRSDKNGRLRFWAKLVVKQREGGGICNTFYGVGQIPNEALVENYFGLLQRLNQMRFKVYPWKNTEENRQKVLAKAVDDDTFDLQLYHCIFPPIDWSDPVKARKVADLLLEYLLKWQRDGKEKSEKSNQSAEIGETAQSAETPEGPAAPAPAPQAGQ